MTTTTLLRVLVAEDSEEDFALLVRELERGGFVVDAERVASAAALGAALDRALLRDPGRGPDIVITDWRMPGFGGRAVLEALAARGVAAPCIVWSGTVGEEPAVEALRAGAVDFLSKDKPRMLAPAVERALREARARASALALRQRSAALELENRRVVEASRLKSEFLANMSHELRTPLNAILGFAELLHDGAVDPASPQHREFLGDILTSGRHLLQMINDVLDLAKVEAGALALHPEPVALDAVIGEVVASLRPTAAARRIALGAELEAMPVELDPARLKQVAYNFLSNALKFTPEGGRVTIRVFPEAAAWLRLEVEDTGVGIAPEDVGRLFVAFQQLEAGAAKRHQGTGLGLALTRRLVEAQGGSVGVTSRLGAGSTFHARLPLAGSGG